MDVVGECGDWGSPGCHQKQLNKPSTSPYIVVVSANPELRRFFPWVTAIATVTRLISCGSANPTVLPALSRESPPTPRCPALSREALPTPRYPELSPFSVRRLTYDPTPPLVLSSRLYTHPHSVIVISTLHVPNSHRFITPADTVEHICYLTYNSSLS